MKKSKQEVFNDVVNHARKQGCKSKGIICAYRGNNGTKCFIGIFIPDNLYSCVMEGDNVFELESYYPEIFEIFEKDVDMGFLNDIQGIHDMASVDEWESHFEVLALRNNLIYSV